MYVRIHPDNCRCTPRIRHQNYKVLDKVDELLIETLERKLVGLFRGNLNDIFEGIGSDAGSES